ncbi:MAG: ABC transporter permease [Cellulosilyticaceae bacterium]
MLTITEKELRSYFSSPIGYVFIGFFLFMFGLYFTFYNVLSQNGDYTYVIGAMTNILVFGIPIITMKLMADERKNKTDQLLLTAPVTATDIVVGKYIAATALYGITLVVTMIHPLLLMWVGNVPVGKIMGAYIGFFLMGASLIAIGLLISSLCENQIVAAIGTIGTFFILFFMDSLVTVVPKERLSSLMFMLVLIGMVGLLFYGLTKQRIISMGVILLGGVGVVGTFFANGALFDGLPTKVLQWLSLFNRYEGFSRGLLDLGAIVYYLSFIIICIFVTVQVTEKRRWN